MKNPKPGKTPRADKTPSIALPSDGGRRLGPQGSAGDVHDLQRSVGNRAVERLLTSSRGGQAKTERGSTGVTQTRVSQAYFSGNSEQAASEIRSRKGPGTPLDEKTSRSDPELSHIDLSEVRVHTDDFADRTARDLDAEAFTVGSDIFFRRGRLAPETHSGRDLLNHELAHVGQHLQGRASGAEASLEREAESFTGGGRDPLSAQAGGEVPAAGAAEAAAPVLRDGTGAKVSSVKITLPGKIEFFGNKGTITASVRTNIPADTYKIQFDPAANELAVTPWPTKDIILEVSLKADEAGIEKYKSYLNSMTSPVTLTVVEGSDVGKTVGAGTAEGEVGRGGVKEEGGGSKEKEGGQEKETGGGGGAQEGKQEDEPTGGGGTAETASKGASAPFAEVPEGAPVPVITITDLSQIDELKKRGLIPAKSADQIKAKLEKQETLTFEEAVVLLDGLNRLVTASESKDEAAQATESWLKWAKFIEENKDKFSGQTKASQQGLTVDEVREILKKQKEFVGVKDAPARTTKDAVHDPERRKSWNNLQDWEKKLWTDYIDKYGGTADVTDSSSKDLTITKDVRFSMALRMSPQYMAPGARAAAEALFNDPIFIGATIAGITAYLALWLAPEPVFTKAAAVLTTIGLLSLVAFSVSEIKNLASAWMTLQDESAKSTTLPELEKAAEKFGTAIGGSGLRILVALATVLLGKAAPKPRPLPPPSGGGGMAAAGAGGGTVVIPRAAPAVGVKVLPDGSIIVIGPQAGVAMASTKGGGGSGRGRVEERKPPKKTDEPSEAEAAKPGEKSMRLTANVRRALRKLSKTSGISRGELSKRFHRIKSHGATSEPTGKNYIDDLSGDVYDGNRDYIGNVFDDF